MKSWQNSQEQKLKIKIIKTKVEIPTIKMINLWFTWKEKKKGKNKRKSNDKPPWHHQHVLYTKKEDMMLLHWHNENRFCCFKEMLHMAPKVRGCLSCVYNFLN